MEKTGKIELKNGMNIYWHKMDSSLIYGEIVVKAGSLREPENRRGLAHLLEHCVFEGSRNYPTREKSEEAAADLGIRLNASTSFREVKFPINTIRDKFLDTLEIVADTAFFPALTNDGLEKERQIVLHELNQYEDSLDFQSDRLLNKLFFRSTPAQEMVIGKRQYIESATLDELTNYHHENYTASNSEVYVCGSITQKMLKTICTLFEGIPSGDKPAEITLNLPQLEKSEKFVETSKVKNMSYGRIIFRTAPIKTEEDAIMPLLGKVLNGIGNSSLFEVIRQRKKLAYSIHTKSYADLAFGYFFVGFSVAPRDEEECIETCLKHLRSLNPETKELKRARTALQIEYASLYDEKWTEFSDFIHLKQFGLNKREYRQKSLEATRKDLQDFAQKYLSGIHQIALLVPEK